MIKNSANSFEIAFAINKRIVIAVGYVNISKMINGVPKLSACDFTHNTDKDGESHFNPSFAVLRCEYSSGAIIALKSHPRSGGLLEIKNKKSYSELSSFIK